MAKKITRIFSCKNCGAQFPKWSGRCLECGGWGTLEEGLADNAKSNKASPEAAPPAKIIDLAKTPSLAGQRIKTGISEIDRVLGGGFVPGSLVLLSGEPGIGKSTILSQIAESIGSEKEKVYYISGEESALQVKKRMERLGCALDKTAFSQESSLEKIISLLSQKRPRLAIVDSIQTVYSLAVEAEAGSISQIRSATVSFLELAKKYGICLILVGHITKDGQVAGPKSLEHIVDAVMNLETQKKGDFRILRAQKNRFGAVSEIGIFEMTGRGFREVKNPGSFFLRDNMNAQYPGSATSVIIEGSRPFLLEVQALVSRTVFGYPQRKGSGFDINRLQVLVSVLSRRAGVKLVNQDIILNVVGGHKINDPSLDLPVCLAVCSSLFDIPLPPEAVIIGEIGLGGELRAVDRLEIRLKEAKRQGFKKAIVPGARSNPRSMDMENPAHLKEAIKKMLK